MAVCQGVKKGFSKKMCTFSFCLFYVGERKIEKMKNMEKKIQKSPEKSCFGGGCEENWSFL